MKKIKFVPIYILVISLCPFLFCSKSIAKTFVLPHVLETSGSITDSGKGKEKNQVQFTFDTTVDFFRNHNKALAKF